MFGRLGLYPDLGHKHLLLVLGGRRVESGTQGAYSLGLVRDGDGYSQSLGKKLLETGVMGYATGKDESFLDTSAADHTAHAVHNGLVQSQGYALAIRSTGDE